MDNFQGVPISVVAYFMVFQESKILYNSVICVCIYVSVPVDITNDKKRSFWWNFLIQVTNKASFRGALVFK